MIHQILSRFMPVESSTAALVGGVLLVVAVVAALVPARRAASVDPIAALRCE